MIATLTIGNRRAGSRRRAEACATIADRVDARRRFADALRKDGESGPGAEFSAANRCAPRFARGRREQESSRPTTTEVKMDTALQEAEQRVKTQLKRVRWALGLNGALSIALGVVIIIWPGISLYSLVIVFGAYSLARGSSASSPPRGSGQGGTGGSSSRAWPGSPSA